MSERTGLSISQESHKWSPVHSPWWRCRSSEGWGESVLEPLIIHKVVSLISTWMHNPIVRQSDIIQLKSPLRYVRNDDEVESKADHPDETDGLHIVW